MESAKNSRKSNDILITVRNKVHSFLYKNITKRIFFLQDPEKVHDRITTLAEFFGKNSFSRKIISLGFSYNNKMLKQRILGIDFSNPIGLAAGFDKNALLTDFMPSIGFGFEEVGSITGEPCDGNPKPRLWRLKISKGLVVYYGLKNDGCKKIAKRLRGKKFNFPVGISIAKTNNKETVDTKKGVADYVKAYKEFTNIGDYTTINISCPNAYGGEPFTDPKKLDKLLFEITKIKCKKPIFIKLSPDLEKKQIDYILEVIKKHKIQGIICSNLTKKRKNNKIKEKNIPKKGGISGKVVEKLSDDLISYIYKKTKGKFIIIGVGGVFTAEDAYEKIKSGASLIQLITGMVFEGPQVVSEINRGLAKLLKKDGFSNISEAVGVKNK